MGWINSELALVALLDAQESGAIDRAVYVLVAPSANPAWRRAADRYQALLSPAVRPTFQFRTLDVLVDTAADLLPHAAELRRRYLDVDLSTPAV